MIISMLSTTMLLKVMLGILLIYGKCVDHIQLLIGEVWAYTTCLPATLSLKCMYQGRKVSGRVCVLDVSILILSVIFMLKFETVRQVLFLAMNYTLIILNDEF
jgi:hypothetical protein